MIKRNGAVSFQDALCLKSSMLASRALMQSRSWTMLASRVSMPSLSWAMLASRVSISCLN